MARQIVSRVRLAGKAISEAGAIVDIRRGVSAPRERDVAAYVESVALVVIERRKFRKHGEVGQAARDRATAFCDLVRISEMDASMTCNQRRAQSKFPATNQGLGNGNREKDARSADVVVVEEIPHVGAEVIGIENPTAQRNAHAKLSLFVEFAVQRYESQALPLREIDQRRAGSGFKRRRLVETPVEGAERPAKTGDRERCTEARTDRGFRDSVRVVAGKARGPDAGGKSHPGEGLEFVVDEESFKMGGGALGIGDGRVAAAVVEDSAEELIVTFVEAEKSGLQVVSREAGLDGGLSAGIGRAAVLGGGDRGIGGQAGVVAAVVMVEGRDRHHELRTERVNPGEDHARIGLALTVAKSDARPLRAEIICRDGPVFDVVRIRIVGDLEVVAPKRRHQAQLVGGIYVVDE